ncbi:unnamed protein product [Alopecurus aequalis]
MKRCTRAPPPAAESDDILRKIFLLLDSPADLARACAASLAFRRIITDSRFLRCFHTLHPPPLVGIFDVFLNVFHPAEPPHPSESAARGLIRSGAIDFSCKSFLPSPGPWYLGDSREGRVLYYSDPRHKGGCCYNHRYLDRPVVVCDPLHRRYIVLPAIPDDLATLVEHGQRLHHFSCFLASPAEDELQDEAPLATHPAEEEKGSTSPSFRVMCVVQSASKLVLFVFSSSSSGVGAQQWRAINFNDLSSLSDDMENNHRTPSLLGRSYVHGRFYWQVFDARKKLVVLDARESTPRFFTMDFPPLARESPEQSFVEAAGEQERLAVVYMRHTDVYRLHYAVLQGDDGERWELEATITLPSQYQYYKFIDVAGGYLLLEGTSEGRKEISGPDIGCFSLDLRTLHVQLFRGSKYRIGVLFYLYAGYPLYLSPPTI